MSVMFAVVEAVSVETCQIWVNVKPCVMYVTFMSISTRSLADVVKETIEKDAVIKKGLARNLINIRALARVIQGTVGEKTSLEAIVSAIRRYPFRR